MYTFNNECESSFLVSDSAHTTFYTVRLKHSTIGTRRKAHFDWTLKEGFKDGQLNAVLECNHRGKRCRQCWMKAVIMVLSETETKGHYVF